MFKLEEGPRTWAVKDESPVHALTIGTIVEQKDTMVFYPASDVFLEEDDLRWLANALHRDEPIGVDNVDQS